MGPISDWEEYKALPPTLDELLEEVEINNSFTRNDVKDQLIDSLEDSFSYLYKVQMTAPVFRQFHYQTREFLLDTTYNDISISLTEYRAQLEELSKDPKTNAKKIEEVKRKIAELGEVRFGDLYLDKKRRVSIEVPFDPVRLKARDFFRTSPYYKKDMAINTMITKKTWFDAVPIAILDGTVRTDLLVLPIEQGTKIIFTNLLPKDLYDNEERQIFHDVDILFVSPIYYQTFLYPGSLSGHFSFDQYPGTKALKDLPGMLLVSVDAGDGKTYSDFGEATFDETGFYITPTPSMTSVARGGGNLTLIFCADMHKIPYNITSEKRIYETPELHEEKRESHFFIPRNDKDEPYAMPIPEHKMLVCRTIKQKFMPDYDTSVKFYYPNIYQVVDPEMGDSASYTVYYFYHEIEDIRFTPLFSFYYDYLRRHYPSMTTLEEILNAIYFKHDGYDAGMQGAGNAEILAEFYQTFENLLEYHDYRYKYGTPDFMTEYDEDKYPLEYQVQKMKEFIRADWRILPDYVDRNRNLENMYHFFTNTIKLSGRFRRSSRLESKESEPVLFGTGCKRCAGTVKGALQVTDSLSYDPKTQIYIEDAKIAIPDIVKGEYVSFATLTDRYVFAFRNVSDIKHLPLKIFVDGLLVGDLECVTSFGMNYFYLPVSSVSEDSYLMMEIDRGMEHPQEFELTFTNSTEWKTVHLEEVNGIQFTMQDLHIRIDDEVIDRDQYTLELVRNKVQYDMEDENHKVVNKFGIVTDVALQLTKLNITKETKVMLILNKVALNQYGTETRNGYPRFDLRALKILPDIGFAKSYSGGRLLPSYALRSINSAGRVYIQSRLFIKKGQDYYFEVSPYSTQLVCSAGEFNFDEPFDFSKYIDKPISPIHYEVYVNGRRLGLPNLFNFGPYHGLFRGLKANCLLEIYEKERDFEYFGYSQITDKQDGSKYDFFYEPYDLYSASFMTEAEAKALMDAYVEMVKDPRVNIQKNVAEEEPISHMVEFGLVEEVKIFFFEELLPLGLSSGNFLQFNKEYLSEVFPDLTKEFVIDSPEKGKPRIVFLNPNQTARIIDSQTGEYEMIDTKDADPDKEFIMLTGEVYTDEERRLANAGSL